MKKNSAKMYKNGIFEIDYIDFFLIIIVQTNQLIHLNFRLITFSFVIEVKSSRHFHLMVFFHNFLIIFSFENNYYILALVLLRGSI